MSVVRIDFLHSRRTAWTGVGLLLLGAGSLAAALWIDRSWAAERAARQEFERARLETASKARRAALLPLPITLEQRRMQRIAPVLRQPWLPTLRLIENATEPPIYLLGLSIEPNTGTVQMEGEAPDFKSALLYVQAIDEEGLLGPAQIRSHEQVNEAGRSAVRFKIATRWIVR